MVRTRRLAFIEHLLHAECWAKGFIYMIPLVLFLYELGTIIVPILQMRKLRLIEEKGCCHRSLSEEVEGCWASKQAASLLDLNHLLL